MGCGSFSEGGIHISTSEVFSVALGASLFFLSYLRQDIDQFVFALLVRSGFPLPIVFCGCFYGLFI